MPFMRPRDDGGGGVGLSAVGSRLILDDAGLAEGSFFTLASFLTPGSFLTGVSFFTFGSCLTAGGFLAVGSFLAAAGFFSTGSFLVIVDGCCTWSPVARSMGPGPLVGSFNQASVSFGHLAVCLGRLGGCDDGCLVAGLVSFLGGLEDAVSSAFFFVGFDGAVLAFLAGGWLSVSLTATGNPWKLFPKLMLILILFMFPQGSDCFRFLPTTEGSLLIAGAILALYWAFAFLSAAAYSFFISASILMMLGGTSSLDWCSASNRRILALALSFEGGSP